VKRRLGIVVVVLAASVLALASPAEAKGMSGVTITGTGLGRPIVLDFRTDGAAFERLMAVAPYFGDTTGAGVPARPTELGLPLRLTWSLEWETTQHVVQLIYPYAPGGPVVHTPAGQPIFDRRTVSEWYQTGPSTLAVLQSVGVPSADELRAARAVMAVAWSWITAGQALVRW
jgi:hypothetical protein